MAVSTSTSSPLPFLFLHRGAANTTPATISFPSSLRASSLRSRAAAATPAETLSDEGLPDAPPEGEGTGIPLPSSIGDDGEQEKIVITNRYGEKLVGVLHEAGSKDIVVLCHGFRSSKESRTILSLANALTSEKIFRFDFSGNGESEGTFQYGNYYREVHDLCHVILHFKNQKRNTHAIAGHSKGGNVVVLYASMYRDIPSVISMCGRFNLERGIGDRFGNDYMERISQHGFH